MNKRIYKPDDRRRPGNRDCTYEARIYESHMESGGCSAQLPGPASRFDAGFARSTYRMMMWRPAGQLMQCHTRNLKSISACYAAARRSSSDVTHMVHGMNTAQKGVSVVATRRHLEQIQVVKIRKKVIGGCRDSNPGPLAPKARIIASRQQPP